MNETGSNSKTILELNNVSKEFISETGIIHKVLDNINLKVKQEEFVSLVGPSGCGKTTLLNIIGGFLTPDSGDVLIEDKKASHMGNNANVY